MIFLFASATLLTGCGSTYSVTSKSMFNKTVNEVKADLAKQGYNLSGSNTETKNNVYVEGTSYSRYAGYGSKMANDFVTTDTYHFTNEDGSTMSFSVAYKVNRDVFDGRAYVTEVSTVGCETSDARQYDMLCGNNSPVKKLGELPKDASIEVPDVVGNTLLVTGLGLLSVVILYAIFL